MRSLLRRLAVLRTKLIVFSRTRLRRAHFDEPTARVIRAVRPHTMTSPQRIEALCDAVRYVSEHGIAGAIVECGVWKGGSMMAAALTLLEAGDKRDLYLFDTFAGMTAPDDVDRVFTGLPASDILSTDTRRAGNTWAVSGRDEVAANMASTGYPMDLVHLVEGPVEETIPDAAPSEIALLRLDTDWYASTAHELRHLMPRLQSGGVLIIDDYGHWEGARRAVDEYVTETGLRVLLHRIDYTGRITVVP